MDKKNRPLLFILGILLVIVGVFVIRIKTTSPYSSTPKSEISFYTAVEPITVGQEFEVKMKINPSGNSVNLVEPHFKFDNSVVELLTIDPSGPFINTVATPSIPNGRASISVATISLGEAVVKEADVVTLKFRALRPGEVLVDLDQESFVGSMIPKNKATNMLNKFTGINLIISANG